jgi:PII interaction protein X
MSSENYLNHPTFGLLFRLCLVEDDRELFSTIYAQRLFFLVETSNRGLQFEAIGRTDARLLMENRMRNLRRMGFPQQEYDKLQQLYKQTF